jgi:hypothetical protein
MANTVNILGIPYTVERVPVVNKGAYALGQIDYGQQRITIDEDLREERAQVTLLHEVIHGILESLGFDEETKNENMVQSLALGMYQFLVTNPKFHKTLKKDVV